MDDGLFKHVISQFNSQHQELRAEMKEMHGKIDKLSEFKIKMITHSWWVSIITSGVCGIATIIAASLITHKLK